MLNDTSEKKKKEKIKKFQNYCRFLPFFFPGQHDRKEIESRRKKKVSSFKILTLLSINYCKKKNESNIAQSNVQQLPFAFLFFFCFAIFA